MPEPIRRLESKTVVLPIDNIDTDQIIPARFLTVTTRQGLGPRLFADWRYDAEGRPRPEFALNRPQAAGAQVLVAGHNFGCGSSREHAPWALADAGFKAVVATSFADIFRGNALKNGLLPVQVDQKTHGKLLAAPGALVVIDVEAQTIALGSHSAPFPLAPFARYCLLQGVDELQFLLSQEPAIAAYEARHAGEV
ncbi:MAG TPA: 3-isopropylmalate dehydratase small subunit [Vicinamibacteria bacterium]|nr:3-isopropylmalate dehydratase small subunit [Vicinamibacteria bacterium]